MQRVFSELETWSTIQRRIYDAFVANDSLYLTVPGRCGATTVVAGLAVALGMNGKRVLVVCSTKDKYNVMFIQLQHYLRGNPLQLTSLTNHGVITLVASGGVIECTVFNPRFCYIRHLAEYILIDNAHTASPDLFFKLVVPAMQRQPIHFLAIGRATDPEDESSLAHALTLVPDEFVRKIQMEYEAPHWALWLNKAKTRRLKRLRKR